MQIHADECIENILLLRESNRSGQFSDEIDVRMAVDWLDYRS